MYAQADLRLCWLHIPHCWKSHVTAHIFSESADNSEIIEAVKTYEDMLLFMFQQALPVVQNILDHHGKDLGVHTEGRRFVYYYAKLPQLQ